MAFVSVKDVLEGDLFLTGLLPLRDFWTEERNSASFALKVSHFLHNNISKNHWKFRETYSWMFLVSSRRISNCRLIIDSRFPRAWQSLRNRRLNFTGYDAYLDGPQVISGGHKILAQHCDPFYMSSPFRWCIENSGGRGKERSCQGRIRNQEWTQDRKQSWSTVCEFRARSELVNPVEGGVYLPIEGSAG